jgi:hypothetical protein
MTTPTIYGTNSLSTLNLNEQEISNELSLNYHKTSFMKNNGVTKINIDRAIKGKGDFENTKSYSQNLVTKYEFTGNKEVCIRKILIIKNEQNTFDITVRELKVFYRKEKKHRFNKVIRFKSSMGTIEHVLEILKNQKKSNFHLN